MSCWYFIEKLNNSLISVVMEMKSKDEKRTPLKISKKKVVMIRKEKILKIKIKKNIKSVR